VLPVLDEAARIGERLSELARLAFHEVIVVDGGQQRSDTGHRAEVFPASWSSRLHAGEPAR